ncbi:MAG: hypothetical protein CML33_07325 [Rhodobacteraceae bacterium]|nr:hypothetical protein [Paracoccaceae bacterium]
MRNLQGLFCNLDGKIYYKVDFCEKKIGFASILMRERKLYGIQNAAWDAEIINLPKLRLFGAQPIFSV